MLLNAYYQWASQFDEPIHISVDNNSFNDKFLYNYQNAKGMVVLNISPSSSLNLKITDESLSFSTGFNGVHKDLNIPLKYVIGYFYPIEKNDVAKLFTLPYQGMFDFKNPDMFIEIQKSVTPANTNNVVSIADRFGKKNDK